MESVSALQFLKDKTILVTGATGFLAKIFVEKVLRVQPNVKRLYLLVRAGDKKSATSRILNEVVEKELFKVLRESCGANLMSFISEKVVAVEGDVSCVNLGVNNSQVMEEMWREIDLVVNFAATTEFYERYDLAFGVNTMGALHVLSFAKKCIKIKMFLHVSTAYVCGEGSGLIRENSFHNGEALKGTLKLDIPAEKKLIEEKLNQLQKKGATKEEVTSTMKDLGIQRAKLYGWPNTYVFTKAMGEMIIGNCRDNLPLIIVRPTIVASTYKDPFPGWIEGVRTIDGPIVSFGKGRLRLMHANTNTICDIMPADMVVNSMIMAMAANTEQSSQIIYQIGSSLRNPFKLSNLHECMTCYFTKYPLINKIGQPIKVSKGTILKSSASFHIYMIIRYVIPLKVLKLVSVFCQKYKDACVDSDKKIRFVLRLVELYKPYMFFKGIFDDTNSEKLRMAINGEEVDTFNFDPRCIDWEDYIVNTHIAGLVKYVIKM